MEGCPQDEYCHYDCRQPWYLFSLNLALCTKSCLGDVQPYVALGRLLKKDGHRIRIASHETFRDFVNENGLEFFDIGGNPQDLMSYMVKSTFYLFRIYLR